MDHLLSQLSYEPMFDFWNIRFCFPFTRNSQISALLCRPLALPAELRAHMFYFWNVRFRFLGTRKISEFCVALWTTRPPS